MLKQQVKQLSGGVSTSTNVTSTEPLKPAGNNSSITVHVKSKLKQSVTTVYVAVRVNSDTITCSSKVMLVTVLLRAVFLVVLRCVHSESAVTTVLFL
jgi:hypothetical protein